MKHWTLGLTGGIGSGKSTVAQYFAELGVALIDADQAARWVVKPGRPALASIAEHFGGQILQADGQLDRAALRQRIFADSGERHWLEQLLHPLIEQEISQYLEQAPGPYSILASPLLIESGQYRLTQRVLVIDVPEALQIERTMQRDGASRQQVEAIMAAQSSREKRLQHADDVLDNSQNMQWIRREVERLHNFYLSLNGAKP